MENRNWKHFFRWSLGLHLVVLTALGLVLQQGLRTEQRTEPIRVKVEGFGPAGAPGAGQKGSNGGGIAGTEGSETAASRPSGAAGAGPHDGEASLSSEAALQELLQAPVAAPSSGVSGENPAASGTVSGSTDSSADSGAAGNVSTGDASGQGDGQGYGSGNGAGSGADSGGAGGDGTAGDGAGGGPSGGGAQADLSQDAALQGYSKIYPRAARDAGEEGVAVVGVSVSPGGSVTRAWLEQSTGYDRLDRAALKAAYQWSFSPARNVAGDPIAGESRVTVRYQLDE